MLWNSAYLFIFLHRTDQRQAIYDTGYHCHQSHYNELDLLFSIQYLSLVILILFTIFYFNRFGQSVWYYLDLYHTSHILLKKKKIYVVGLKGTTSNNSPANTSPTVKTICVLSVDFLVTEFDRRIDWGAVHSYTFDLKTVSKGFSWFFLVEILILEFFSYPILLKFEVMKSCQSINKRFQTIF